MNNSTTLPAIFLAYQDPGFHLPLFLPALSLTIPATIGIILNSSVCYITWKYWYLLFAPFKILDSKFFIIKTLAGIPSRYARKFFVSFRFRRFSWIFDDFRFVSCFV
uniref:Uncharacterized protein n=1 Tax=Meloidogyne enterolobii TaxID=390850 RepID=A0A6V7W694_MELEN|nr:unnamed protein product [Meloidogyne enterolobii]